MGFGNLFCTATYLGILKLGVISISNFQKTKDRKRNNLSISKPKYDSVGFAHRIIFGFYLICDPNYKLTV